MLIIFQLSAPNTEVGVGISINHPVTNLENGIPKKTSECSTVMKLRKLCGKKSGNRSYLNRVK